MLLPSQPVLLLCNSVSIRSLALLCSLLLLLPFASERVSVVSRQIALVVGSHSSFILFHEFARYITTWTHIDKLNKEQNRYKMK